MSGIVRGRRWTGWSSRKPSVVRPFPVLRCEELETREVPATFTWTGLGGNTSWNNPGNWSGAGGAPTGLAANTEDLVFPAGVAAGFRTADNNIPNGVFNSIVFGDGGYTVTGLPLTLGLPGVLNSGFISVGSGAAGNSLGTPITLGVSTGTTIANTQTFTVLDGGFLNISGAISGAVISTLTKDGDGTLQLSGNNTGLLGEVKVADTSGVLVISNANALGATTAPTTVGTGSTLRLESAAGITVPEPLILNGLGVANDGALLNRLGNNTWSGTITLDSDAAIGAFADGTTNTVLRITGVISDFGSGHSIFKEGQGDVQFNSPTGNTYRGLTTISDGSLTIAHPLALGAPLPGDVPSAANGTVVRQTLTGFGQLRMASTASVGADFTVLDEFLTLNGAGRDGRGSLSNRVGNNTWAGPVTLGSPSGTTATSVSIGSAPGTSLTISGVVSGTAAFQLNKVDTGILVFNNANTYAGTTNVQAGILNIRDSNSLGVANTTNVFTGASLELEVEFADQLNNPRFDAHNRDLWNDSVTHDANKLIVPEVFSIAGRGVGNTGAIRSKSGINVLTGNVTLNGLGTAVGIGVDPETSPYRGGHPTPDRSYLTDDYSLNITGSVISTGGGFPSLVGLAPPDLAKRLGGHLILASNNPAFDGRTLIEQGWITIRSTQSLGDRIGNTVNSVTPRVYAHEGPSVIVSSGAALHIKPLTPGGSLSMPQYISLSGFGVTAPTYPLIREKGALVNLDGNNTWTGDIFLNGQAGIGVEVTDAVSTTSELTTTGTIRDERGVNGEGVAPTRGGITKFGSKRLVIQGDGTYSLDNEIREGTIRLQNDTGLGQRTSGTFLSNETYETTRTTVASGAVLELTTSVPRLNGGIGSGVQVWNEQLNLGAPAMQIGLAGVLANGRYSLTYTYDTTGNTETSVELPITAPGTGGTLPTDSLQNALNAMPNLVAAVGPITVTSNPTGDVHTIRFGNARTPDVVFNNFRWNTVGGAEVVVSGGNAPLVTLADDNAWRGPVTLDADTRVNVAANSRLSLLGNIGDGSNLDADGSDLVKRGPSELILGGTSNYRGQTRVEQGVVTAVSSGAFGAAGSPASGTIVSRNAQIQLQGSLTIAGEDLTLVGTGWSQNQFLTLGGTSGNFTLSFLGRTTATVPYNATAAQVQNALNAALSTPAFTPEIQTVRVTGTAGTFTLTFNGQTTAPLAFNASATTVQTALRGLSTIGANNVFVTSATVDTVTTYTIVFGGTLGSANQTQITALGINGANVTATTAIDGGGAAGSVLVTEDPTVTPVGSRLIITFVGPLATATMPPITTTTTAGNASPIASLGTNAEATNKWLDAGPAPTNNGLSALARPTSGRVTGITADPRDANIIYITTAGGGAWKTRDGGLSWLPLFDNTVDPAAVMFGGSIAIAPSDSNTIYFATGDPNGGAPGGLNPLVPSPNATGNPIQNPRDNFAGFGVYRSTDAGLTWTLLTGPGGVNPIAGQAINKVVVHPTNSNLIYTATSNVGSLNTLNGPHGPVAGIWRYNGTTWYNLVDPDTAVSTTRQGTPGQAPYNAPPIPPPPPPNPPSPPPPPPPSEGVGPPGTIGPDDDYRLTFPARSAAANWSDLYISNGGVLFAALSDAQEQAFVWNGTAGVQPTQQAIRRGVYWTTDPAAQSNNPNWFVGVGVFGTAPAPDNRAAGAFPMNDPTVNAIPLAQTIKLGGSMNQVFPVVAPVFTTTDVFATITSGSTTTNVNDQLIQVVRLTHTITAPITTSSGWSTVNNGSTSVIPANVFGAAPPLGHFNHTIVAANNRNPSGGITVYVGGFNTLWQSNDSGVNFFPVADIAGPFPGHQFHALAIDYTSVQNPRLYTGSDGGVWRFNPANATFQDLNGANLSITQFNSVDPHPTDFNRALAGSADNGVMAYGSTGTANLAWTRLDPPTATVAPSSAGVVRYDPKNPLNAYAARDGQLWQTTNGGTTWTLRRDVLTTAVVLPNSTNNYFPLVVDPVNTNRIVYAAPATGIEEWVNPGPSTAGRTNLTNAGGANPYTLGGPSAIALSTFQGQYVFDPRFPVVTDKLSNTYDPDTIYATNGSAIQLTKDHGINWVNSTLPINRTLHQIEFGGVWSFKNAPEITATATGGAYVTVKTVRDGSPNTVNGPTSFPISAPNGPGRERQIIEVFSGSNSGTFTLTFNGQTTAPLAYNASTATVLAALNGLTSVPVAGSEVQDIRVNGTGPGALTGEFTLSFGAQTTAPIPTGAAAGTIQAALQGLSSIGAGNVSVVPVPTPTTTGISFTYRVTFTGALANTNVGMITSNGGLGGAVVQITLVNEGAAAGAAGTLFAFTPTAPSPPYVSNPTVVSDLAVDPANRDTVFAAVRYSNRHSGPAVFRTTNAGQTWTDITGNLPSSPVYKVIVDPRDGAVYVGTDDGVWALSDGRNATAATANWRVVGSAMPGVQVRDLVLNQQLNTLTAGTGGRGMLQLFLGDYDANSGALREVSGSSIWTGPVTLTGATSIGAAGTQQIQNGIAVSELDIRGVVRDDIPNADHTITKIGLGTIVFSGTNTYGGQTLVNEGVLRVNNPHALGGDTAIPGDTGENTIVADGAALEMRSDLQAETVVVNGNGIKFPRLGFPGQFVGFNGHFTGALRNVANNNTFTGTLQFGTSTTGSITVGVDTGSKLTIGTKAGLAGTGTITDLGVLPPLTLEKELTGTLILATPNTLGGLVQVSQGALQVQNPGALGASGTAANGTRVLDGAQLQISRPNSASPGIAVSGERLTLAGTGINKTGALLNVREDGLAAGTNDNTWDGPITLTAAASSAAFAPPSNPETQVSFGVSLATDSLTIGGTPTSVIGQAGPDQMGLIKVGPGRLTLAQANTYAGVTNINAGSIRLQDSAALGPPTSSEVQRINVQGVVGTYRLTFKGASVVLNATATAAVVQAALNGVGFAPIGGVGGIVQVSETPTLSGKILTVTFGGSLANTDQPLMVGSNVTGAVLADVSLAQQGGLGTVVASGASLEIDRTGLNVPETLRLLGDGVGTAGALNNVSGVNTYSGAVTLATDPPNAVTGASIGAVTGTELTVTRVQDPTPLVVPAPRLRKLGAGTVVFPNANPYTGATVVDGGVLNIRNPLSLGTGRTEVQQVTITATAGTFRLAFAGVETPNMPVGESGVNVQNQLNALPGIGGSSINGLPGSVSVIRTGVSGAFTYTITFGGGLANVNVPQITVAPAAVASFATTLTDGQGTAETRQVEVIGVGAATFALRFRGATTPALPFNVAPFGGALPTDSLQNALNALSTIGGVGGAVDVHRTPTAGGSNYTIYFRGSLGNMNLPDFDLVPVDTGFGSPIITTVQDGPEGTTVNNGASLELQGGITLATEQLTIRGPGSNDRGALIGTAGVNTIAGSFPVTLTGGAFVGTTGAADGLRFNTPITDRGNPSLPNTGFTVDVVGPGTVTYQAAVSNDYTGTTTVRQGLLVLNAPGTTPIRGPLVVGDDVAGAAGVRNDQNDQIADTSDVTVRSDGTYNLGTFIEQIADLTIDGTVDLPVDDARVQIGAGGRLTTNDVALTGGTIQFGTGGRLVLNGDVTVSDPLRDVESVITGPGLVDLNGLDRTFSVADGPAVNDLRVSAALAATGGGRLVKDGPGRLTFETPAPFAPVIIVVDGDVRVGSVAVPGAFAGPIQLAGDGASLSGNGTVDTVEVSAVVGEVVTVSPGPSATTNAAGILHTTTVTWNPQTTFAVDLITRPPGAFLVPGLDYDQLRVDGDVFLDGTTLTGTVGAGIQFGDQFTIIEVTNGAVQGTFAEPFGPNKVFIDGQKFRVDYSDPTRVVLTRERADATVTLTTPINPITARRPLTFTATIDPENGIPLPTAGTVTFTITRVLTGETQSFPVAVTAGTPGQAVLTIDPTAGGSPAWLDDGGQYVVTAFYGDGQDVFNDSPVVTLTPNLVIEVPAIDVPTVTVPPGGATPLIISPTNPTSVGVQDTATIATVIQQERSAVPSWVVQVLPDGSGSPIRTITGSGPAAGTTFPISTVWNGLDGSAVVAPDGTYDIRVSFTDEWGNTGTATLDNGLIVDNTSPAVGSLTTQFPVIAPGTAGTVPTATDFETTITDANLAGWTLTIRRGATVIRTYTGTGPVVDVTWNGTAADNMTFVSDGDYTATLVATDLAGNTNTPVATVTVTVLANPPALTLTSNTPTVYGQTVTLTSIMTLPANAVPYADGEQVEFRNGGTSLGFATLTQISPTQLRAMLTISDTPGSYLAAGTYSLTAVFAGTAELLPAAAGPITHVVNKATLTVTADSKSRVYGSPTPPLTSMISGFVTGEDLASSGVTGDPSLTTAPATAGVGNYPIVAGLGTLASGNYNFTFVNGTLTVTPAALIVRADDKTKGYGAPVPTLTASVVSGLVNGDTSAVLTGTPVTTATAASAVGSYDITQGTVAAGPNYTVTFQNGTLTVTQATLTVTADNKSKVYGAAVPTLTYTVTGLQLGDTAAGTVNGALTTMATAASPVGSYAIDQGTVGLTSSNYTLNFVPGTLTVTQASLTIAADAKTRAYGVLNPGLTFRVTGLVNGDTPGGVITGDLATTAVLNSPVGNYPITQGTLSAGSNYSFTFTPSTLTVTPAQLVVTADDLSKAYGAAIPSLTFSTTGLAPFDTPGSVLTGALTTSATPASPVGTYPISRGTLALAAGNTNYNLSVTPGTLTVTPAVLTLAADNKTKVFGAPVPPLTYTIVGGLVNGDTATVVTGVPATTGRQNSSIGTYPITQGTLDAGANYAIAFTDGTLTVTSALVTGGGGIPTVTAVGPGAGFAGPVNVYDDHGLKVASYTPFGASFAGGIRTAVADFTGDGISDVVMGTGPGVRTQVVVIDGANGNELFRVQPFESSFIGGVYVAAGDVTGDGPADLIITPDEGGGPRVQVYSGNGFQKVADFFGIDDPDFRGGARPAIGDFTRDGVGDLVVAAGFLGGPRVAVFNGTTLGTTRTKLFNDIFIFEPALRNGAYVAAGDMDGDGIADLIGGGGPGGSPRVLALSGADLMAGAADKSRVVANFFAADVDNRGGVRVTAKDLDGDQFTDLVAGVGPGLGTRVTGYQATTLAAGGTVWQFSFDAYPDFGGGVYVG